MCDKKTNDDVSHFKEMRLEGIHIGYYDRSPEERRFRGLKSEDLKSGILESERPGFKNPAVLFLHGWGSDFSVFRSCLHRIADRRVCALNLPGFGDSEEPPAAWGVGDYADFVASFLKKIQVDKVILIGHSFGGRVIIKLAVKKTLPFQIEKIVLVDSAGVKPRRTLRQNLRLGFYKCARKILSFPAVERFLPGVLEAWRRRAGSADYRSASPRMRECLVKTVNEDLTPLFSSIPYPTLLIWGENDRDTPLGDGKIMERLIPDSGLVTLKNAGHYSFLDQPFVFGRVLDSFLGIQRVS
ncbi:MAG: alpha/beta hydrolase [Synergistaceae bacterium]|nr:alpha/beta hydrolase [Synergistaceae bacterium]